MAKADRNYKIEEVMTGSPPAPRPTMVDGKGMDPNDPIKFNKDTDRIKKVDHYRIRFDIKSFNNSRLRFVPNKDDVFWVQEGTVCPSSRCGLPGIIWVDEVDPGGEWIDVINMDMQPLRFQFTLNFVDKTITNPTPADYIDLDPGGVNEDRGGTGSGFTSSALISVALGVCAGVVAFFGAQLFLT